MIGRRVGVDRVEDLLLLCLVPADRALVQVEFVVTASALILCCLSLAVGSVECCG